MSDSHSDLEDSSALPVPTIESEAAILQAEQEQQAFYPEKNLVINRKEEINLRRLELENSRLEKQIEVEDKREYAEMGTRHQLARFLIFGILPAWVVILFGIVIATGAKWITLSDDVLMAVIAANPLGIGAVILIVCKSFFPPRDARSEK